MVFVGRLGKGSSKIAFQIRTVFEDYQPVEGLVNTGQIIVFVFVLVSFCLSSCKMQDYNHLMRTLVHIKKYSSVAVSTN